MSGSGGGGYIPTQSSVFDCENSIITTNVSSINLEVLNKRKIDDLLIVEIGVSESLVLVDGDGEKLGSILHTNTTDIFECIKLGHEYEAVITNITFPACRVKIKRRKV